MRRLPAALGPRWEVLWPLGLYSLISLLLFGLPILDHPRGSIIAVDEIDSSVFMWFYGWWPHALGHGLNPFVTYHQFVPEGFNLNAIIPVAPSPVTGMQSWFDTVCEVKKV